MFANAVCYSKDYYEKFIESDEIRFYENKKFINSILIPKNEENYNNQNIRFGMLTLAKNNYRSIFLKKDELKKSIDKLEEQRTLAEEEARKSALKQGLSLSEADDKSKQAGLVFKRQISKINFFERPLVDEEFDNSFKEQKVASNDYDISRNRFLSSDITLNGALFSQTQLALDINQNMSKWACLKAMEIKSEQFDCVG